MTSTIRVIEKYDNEFKVIASKPLEPGQKYVIMEEESAGTEYQRRYFFSFLDKLWLSRSWSFPNISELEQTQMTKIDFYLNVKMHYGQGVEFYVWIENGMMKASKERPLDIQQQFYAVPKSYQKYNKQERSSLIQAVLNWANDMGEGKLVDEFKRNYKIVLPGDVA